jgi:hypothetical protein
LRVAEENKGVLETTALPPRPESDALPDVADRNTGDVFSQAVVARTTFTERLDFAKAVFDVVVLAVTFAWAPRPFAKRVAWAWKTFSLAEEVDVVFKLVFNVPANTGEESHLGTLANWRLEGPRGSSIFDREDLRI